MFFAAFFFFSSRRRHTRSLCDWSSDVCSSDLLREAGMEIERFVDPGLPLVSVDENLIVDCVQNRSEERRVGKECRSPVPAEHRKKQPQTQRTSSIAKTATG